MHASTAFDARDARGAGGVAGAFVVSTGRCGSTLLSTLLRAHHDVLSLSEVFSLLGGGRAFERAELDGEQLWRLLGALDPELAALLHAAPVPEILLPPDELAAGLQNRSLSPLSLVALPHLTRRPAELLAELGAVVRGLPRAAVGVQLACVFAWLARRFERRLWIERSGASVEYAALLARHFPGARFVYMVRDGPACALSMARHALFRARVARLLDRDARGDLASSHLLPLPLDRFGAYWSVLMSEARRRIERTPAEERLVLHYEDLVAAPACELSRLLAFLGLDAPDDWLRDAERRITPPANRLCELPIEQRAALERACRPGRRALEALRGMAP